MSDPNRPYEFSKNGLKFKGPTGPYDIPDLISGPMEGLLAVINDAYEAGLQAGTMKSFVEVKS